MYHSYLPSIVIAVAIEIWSRTHLKPISNNFRTGNEMERLGTITEMFYVIVTRKEKCHGLPRVPV